MEPIQPNCGWNWKIVAAYVKAHGCMVIRARVCPIGWNITQCFSFISACFMFVSHFKRWVNSHTNPITRFLNKYSFISKKKIAGKFAMNFRLFPMVRPHVFRTILDSVWTDLYWIIYDNINYEKSETNVHRIDWIMLSSYATEIFNFSLCLLSIFTQSVRTLLSIFQSPVRSNEYFFLNK
jgi:hypothetical protein